MRLPRRTTPALLTVHGRSANPGGNGRRMCEGAAVRAQAAAASQMPICSQDPIQMSIQSCTSQCFRSDAHLISQPLISQPLPNTAIPHTSSRRSPSPHAQTRGNLIAREEMRSSKCVAVSKMRRCSCNRLAVLSWEPLVASSSTHNKFGLARTHSHSSTVPTSEPHTRAKNQRHANTHSLSHTHTSGRS